MAIPRRPLGSNPIVLNAAVHAFYGIFEKLDENQKTLLNELDDLERSEKVIKNAHYGRDLSEQK